MALVDSLRVTIAGYDGLALPENLQEAWVMDIGGTEFDRDAIVGGIEGRLFEEGVHTYIVRDTRSRMNWGASAESFELVLEVPGDISQAIVVVLAELDRVKKQDERSISIADPSQIAREELAKALGIAQEGIEVEGLDETTGGRPLVCRAPDGRRFEVEVNSEGRFYRLRKVE
jgi:hypothetical protein